MEEKRPKRVLLVDDEENARRLFGEVLGDQGYEVHLAGDGEEALARFEAIRPAVVVTDVRMPRMDGEELFARIREKAPSTQIILITAEASVDAATRLIRRGAFDYLQKPFSPLRLVGVVERAFLEGEDEAAQDGGDDPYEAFRQRIEAEYRKQVEFQKWIADKRETALKERSELLERLQAEQESVGRRLEEVQREKLEMEGLLSEEREAKGRVLEARDRALQAARADLEKQEARFERLLLASEEKTRETLEERKELEAEAAALRGAREELEGEVAVLRGAREELEGENVRLRRELEDATKALEEACRRSDELGTALEASRQEGARLAGEVEAQANRLFEAEDRIDEKTRLLESVKTRCAALEEELVAQRAAMEELSSRQEELRRLREGNEALLADFEAHKEAMARSVEDGEARLDELRQALAEATARAAAAQERNGVLQEDVARLEAQLAEKQGRIGELEEEMRAEGLRLRALEATRDGAEARGEALEIRIGELERALEEAERLREEAGFEVERLRMSSEHAGESRERVAELESALEVQRRHGEGMRRRIEQLEAECRRQAGTGEEEGRRLREAEEKALAVEAEAEQLRATVTELRERVRHVGDLTERLDSSRADRAELARRVHELEARLGEMARVEGDGSGDADRLAGACRKLQDRLESFERENAVLREEIGRLRGADAERIALVETLRERLERLEVDPGDAPSSSPGATGPTGDALLSVLAELPLACVLVDEAGEIRWMGRPAFELFGLAEGQPLLGVEARSLEALAPVSELVALAGATLRGPVEGRFTLAPGGMQGERLVEGRLQRLVFEGEPAFLVTFRDVSELRRALDRIEHGRHMARFGERAARDLDKIQEGLGSMRILVEMLQKRLPEDAMVQDFAVHLQGEIDAQSERVAAVYRRRDGEEEPR